MLKKLLVSSIIGASALSMVNANAEIKPARSNIINSTDLNPTLSTSSHFYIGGQLGYANTHMANKLSDLNTTTSFETTKLSNNGLAGRIYAGYEFNPYFAIELGYLQLANANKQGPEDARIEDKLSQNAFDVLAKASMPIAHNFSVYGKLGMAYLTTTINEKVNLATDDHNIPFSINLNNQLGVAKHKWAPEAVIGVNYNLTPNMSVDTSWTHIQPLGNKKPGNIDFVAVGLGYQFG